MHNQWEVRFEDLVKNDLSLKVEAVSNTNNSELLNFLNKNFIDIVIPQLDKYCKPSFLIDNLINRIINAEVLSYNNIESAMILIKSYCSYKINDLLNAIKTKRTNVNDQSFLNELFKELTSL